MKTMFNLLVLAMLTYSVNAQTAEDVIQKYYEVTNAKEKVKHNNIVRKAYMNIGISKTSLYCFYNTQTGDYKEYNFSKALGMLTYDIHLLSNGMGFRYNGKDNTWERLSIEKENDIKKREQALMYIPDIKSHIAYNITYLGEKKKKYMVKFEEKSSHNVTIYHFDKKMHFLAEVEHIKKESKVKETIKRYEKFNEIYFPTVVKVLGIKAEYTDYWFNTDLPANFFDPDEMTDYGGFVSEDDVLKLIKTGKRSNGIKKVKL